MFTYLILFSAFEPRQVEIPPLDHADDYIALRYRTPFLNGCPRAGNGTSFLGVARVQSNIGDLLQFYRVLVF